MKAFMTSEGELAITAESSIEEYALNEWVKQNTDNLCSKYEIEKDSFWIRNNAGDQILKKESY